MAATLTTSPAEQNARRTLAWGAVVLVLGLGVVGTGNPELGAVPVLAGLLLTIFGIHVYGRLGPEEPVLDGGAARSAAGRAAGPGGAVAPAEARQAAWSKVWRGGLIAASGLVVTLGTAAAGGVVVVAYGAILGGGLLLFGGLSALSVPKRAETRVEKRRRMDKSPPP